jgi:hypothetical protein
MKGDKVDSNVDYRDALPVNMTAIPHPIKGAPGYMYQWYGLTSYATGEGKDRGARWVSRTGFDGHYRVSGESLIKESGGVVTVLGTIPGRDQVRIAYSFNNIAVVANEKLFYYNPADGLREITDPDVGAPIDIVWADGVFILTDGEDVYHSTVADEEVFDPLDFGNAQFRPDPSLGLGINEDNELVIFGQKTTEYFVNAGGDDFLYQRINLKALKIGISGVHCKIEMHSKWYGVCRREETGPNISVMQGGGVEQISSREIDKILASYTDLSFVTMDAFERDAVKYVLIHLPHHALLYNENIGQSMGKTVAWSILKSDVLGDNVYRAKNFVLSGDSNKWLCGDKLNSNIGYLDESKATHYGEIAEWLLYTPMVRLESLSVDSMEIETIPGFAPDSDATVFISQTENGYIYSSEWVQLYGDNLDYFQRFVVRRLGYVRDYIGWKLRGASRSRMSFALMNVEAT